MKATRFEFRFRLLIGVVLYVLGFWAPWLRYGADRGHITTTWLELTGFLASHHWVELQPASLLVTSLAIACVVLGAMLRVWGAAYIGSATVKSPAMHAPAVVAEGPYRHLRNPLYLGSFLVSIAVSILMPPTGALFFLIATALQMLRLILGEEAFLESRQGEAYRAYKTRVPRILPRAMPRVPASALRPSWAQALLGEIYPVALAICFAVLAWRYNASLLMQAVIICFGASLVVKAFLPRTAE
ncbi:methyltransferase family protein [Silvibacterium acidisoli]|uniref:methyltransferase family protein n=1 Tax=Acidobacteriaceae bacterium ZG23-2 TaxID=2883246 RepID=UPI00406CD723